MNTIKNNSPWKTFWIMAFLTILGTILRLIFIDKPEGLWNDEYISWHIAAIPLGKNFFDAIFAQCHMPLYYFYLKFFIHYFGNSDLMLRLTSVLTGIFAIWSMYFVGKEFKDQKLGLLCATITTLSSFLIYFSQEVRFYELLFLFSAITLIFTIRLSRNQTLSNFVLFLISNLLIILTHTIGFVFVFFNLLFLSFMFGKTPKFKKPLIVGWSIIFAGIIIFVPFLFKTFTNSPLSQWWDSFTISAIGFLVTDYFSPILTNIVSAPDSFFYNFTFGFVFFALLPAAIALTGIYKAISTKRYDILGIFFVSVATVIILIISSLSGKMVFTTKYTIEIYPTLILLMSFGLLEFKNKALRIGLIFAFCAINLFYIFSNPNSAPKLHRSEGNKIVANLLKNSDLKQGDFIVLNYYPQYKFEKYFNFKDYNVVSINKGNFISYISDIQTLEALRNGNTAYKEVFESSENKYFKTKFKTEVINKIEPKHKVAIVILDTVAPFSPVKMQTVVMDEKEYKKTAFLYLAFSHLKNEELRECLKDLHISRFEQKGSWSVVTFVK